MNNHPRVIEGVLPATDKIDPRDYQAWAFHAMAEAIREYIGPFVVEGSVGAGKTIMMGIVLARIRELNRTALVLARAGELVKQNAEAFWECGVKNSIYSASLGIKSKHYPVIVGTEGTIANALFIEDELDKFAPDFLIIDECHEVGFDNPESQYMKIITTLLERNKNLRIIGLSGTPYRDNMDIVGSFWKKCVYRVKSAYLVDRGFLVPDIFGVGDDSEITYDLSQWKVDDSKDDFTASELEEMQDYMLEHEEITRDIVARILHHTEHRNCVLITGAGLKHLKQIAKYLPDGSWGIITSTECLTSAGIGKRPEILQAAYDGKIKHLLQVGCLSTGVDLPLIDTSAIMRKICSLRILEQLMGRGKRLLKPFQEHAGYFKQDHLILDFTETFEAMHDQYSSPDLEAYVKAVDTKREVELIECPVCQSKNSPRARRCSNRPDDPVIFAPVMVAPQSTIKNYSIDGRCEWFWSFVQCKSCGTPNDACARDCRKCGGTLIDPNKNLSGKHYTDADWREVEKMEIRLTKCKQGLLVSYTLAGDPQEGAKLWDGKEQASELLWPNKRERWALGMWADFKRKHLHKDWHPRIAGKSTVAIFNDRAIFDVPELITHRVNDKGNSVIHRKQFASGRVAE